MSRRPRLLLIALLAVLAGAPAAHSAASGDNLATAINQTDDRRVSDFAFSVERQRGGTVDNLNQAQAYASCSRCSAVAIAFQIVLVSGQPDEVRPVNVAAAVNENCDTCDSYAGASQFVRSAANLTNKGWEKVAQIRHTLRSLSRSRLTSAELGPKVDEQTQRLREVLDTQLVPVDDGEDDDGDD